MMLLTPGILKIITAFPDPPFDIIENDKKKGFDIELMEAICKQLNLSLSVTKYTGENFNGIFDAVIEKQCDAVISGTTITPEREKLVLFSHSHLEFNQGIAVNHQLTPNVSSTKELSGLVAGIQKGNTSDVVAKKLLAEGFLKAIHYYPYKDISLAIEDLNEGKIGCIIKLFPVISFFVQNHPKLSVPLQIPTHEKIGIGVAKDNQELANVINQTLRTLKQNGVFEKLYTKRFSFLTSGTQ